MANDTADNFGIGATVWPGLAKLAEECAEVIQIIGKLVATGGAPEHWSGLDLAHELTMEMGDVQAALRYVLDRNAYVRTTIDGGLFKQRADDKFVLFQEWDAAARAEQGEATQ